MIDVIATVLAFLLVYGLSWLVTVGIIKLITICFGWSFSWAIATGVWLVRMLARWVMSGERDTGNRG